MISPACSVVGSIALAILSILLVDVVIRKEISDTRLLERFARGIIESDPVIRIYCRVAIETICLIAAVEIVDVSLL